MTETALTPLDNISQQLTSEDAQKRLEQAIEAAKFEFDPDDVMTIATAETLVVADPATYKQGYELLEELANLEDRIATSYSRFDRPLLRLTQFVRALKNPQLTQVSPVKALLSKRLGTWKAERDRLDRIEEQKRQAAADAAAEAAQLEKAATLKRIAQSEPDPILQQAFQQEAAAVESVTVKAAPVEMAPTAPRVAGGHSRTTWRCSIDDVKELMRAWLDGKCHLNEQDIIDGKLQSFLDKQASALKENMTKAYPGCRAVSSSSAVVRRMRR